ncbi:MAG: gamma-glutamylcyclotransferase [Lachnospiraceae bacterium]|nr:gamma-glutamylcyclotransferase [Lachnospiraceae bacterium]
MNIFVYGTLMKGQSANHYLNGADYKGTFCLNGYAMYDIGSFPGIVEKENESVIGEVYSITEAMLPMMDRYEGEGDLYIRREVLVERGTEVEVAWAYIFNRSVDGYSMKREKWGIKKEDYVWYACYGSNTSPERFRYYIKGGKCDANGKYYPGCDDKSDWVEDKWNVFHGKMYFGNESPSWGNKGVAFFEADFPGETYMRMYKITWGQLLGIREQECASPKWYGKTQCLGVDRDNYPIYTLTCETRREQKSPSYEYFKLLENALRQRLAEDGINADEYLKGCGL